MTSKRLAALCQKKNLWSILNDLLPWDEIKFVVGDKSDYLWVKKKVEDLNLTDSWVVLISPIHGSLELEKLSKWILDDGLKVKMQLQLHKYIWHPDKKGV